MVLVSVNNPASQSLLFVNYISLKSSLHSKTEDWDAVTSSVHDATQKVLQTCKSDHIVKNQHTSPQQHLCMHSSDAFIQSNLK